MFDSLILTHTGYSETLNGSTTADCPRFEYFIRWFYCGKCGKAFPGYIGLANMKGFTGITECRECYKSKFITQAEGK